MPGSNWRPFACEANVITNYTNETALIVLIGKIRHNERYVDKLPAADVIIRIEWRRVAEYRQPWPIRPLTFAQRLARAFLQKDAMPFVTAEMLFLPQGRDVEAVCLTVFAVIVALIYLVDALAPKAKKALDPSKKVALKLVKRTELSHDTHMFRFGLPTPEHILGLPIGQHIALSYTDKDGKEQGRPYTPTSSDVDKGHVDFVIKVYFPNERFPEGGKVSQHMHSLKIGDTLDFSGPKGRYEYRGKGTFAIKRLKSQGGGFEIRKAKKIGMIAGGTGITPMLQVMRAVFRDKGDKTDMSLIFANQTEEDILLRDELDKCERDHDNFKLHYTVDRPPAKGWRYDTGFVTAEMIKKHMPPPGKDTQILLCGPPPMIKFAIMPAFEQLGYTKDMFIQW